MEAELTTNIAVPKGVPKGAASTPGVLGSKRESALRAKEEVADDAYDEFLGEESSDDESYVEKGGKSDDGGDGDDDDDDDDDEGGNNEGGHGERGGERGGQRLDAASRLREAVDYAAMSAGRSAREEVRVTAEAAPPVECGDVGELLRRFLERYSRGTLRIDDPMQGGGGSDIGAKAFRFAEVRVLRVAFMAVRHLPCSLLLLHRLHVPVLPGEP